MKKILLALLCLAAGAIGFADDQSLFFRAEFLPVAGTPAAAIASADVEKLSPGLRGAVLVGADFAGVDRHGSLFQAATPGGLKAGPTLDAFNLKLKATRLAARIAQFRATEAPRGPQTAELLVKVSSMPATRSLAGLPVAESYAKGGLVLLAKHGPISTAELKQLAALPEVTHVEPNHLFFFDDPANPKITPAASPASPPAASDPLYADGSQWGLTWINAPALWKQAATPDGEPDGEPVIVAVIDTGVDREHEDLQGNVLPGLNVLNNSTDTQDDHGHGTHCAGTIAALGNNGKGIAGIGRGVKILPVKAFDSAGFGGTTLQLKKAFDFVLEQKPRVKVINVSWGSPEYDETIAAVLRQVSDAGIIVAAAAGNSARNLDPGSPDFAGNYPASLSLPGLISVMAMNEDEQPADFSNYGAATVKLAAPGQAIVSTWLAAEGGYAFEDGTSMAAPHVAGVVAALWRLRGNELARESPLQAARDVVAAVLTMVKPVASLAGKCSTGGCLHYDDERFAFIMPGPGPTAPASPGLSPASPAPLPAPNASPAVEVSGQIEKGTPAIGGEVTPVILRGADFTYEIQGASPEINRKLRELAGSVVTARGRVTNLPGIERRPRTVIQVDAVDRK